MFILNFLIWLTAGRSFSALLQGSWG